MNKKHCPALISRMLVLMSAVLFSVYSHSEDRAVVVGVSNYDDPGREPLPGAEHDARNMKEALIKDGMAPSDITVITGDNATFENITSTIMDVMKGMGPDDTFTLSWSGHGEEGQMLVKDGFISNNDLADMFHDAPPNDINIFLDICHACSMDFNPTKGKNTTILGSTEKNGDAAEGVIYEPNAPPEVKGVGTFEYTQAHAKANPSDPYAQGDANKDGIVSPEESMNYINGKMPVVRSKPLSVVFQKACIKKHNTGRKPAAAWKGTVTLSAEGAGQGNLPFGLISSSIKGSSSSLFTFSFLLEEDKEQSNADVKSYKVKEGTFSYKIDTDLIQGGQMQSIDGEAVKEDAMGSTTWRGSGKKPLEAYSVVLTIDNKIGWSNLEINSPEYEMEQNTKMSGKFKLGGLEQDLGDSTSEVVKGNAGFSYPAPWHKGLKALQGNLNWTMKEAGLMMQKKTQEMPAFTGNIFEAMKSDPRIKMFELDNKYPMPPGIPVYDFGVFDCPEVPELGCNGHTNISAKWSLVSLE